jgi:hypothetical protein
MNNTQPSDDHFIGRSISNLLRDMLLFLKKSGPMNVTSYMVAAKGMIGKTIREYYLKK